MIKLTTASAALCLGLVATAWLGNALYALGSTGSALKSWTPLLIAPSMIGFVVFHGFRYEGARGLLLFIGLVFAIGWSAESLSIATGIPFGFYHYTDIMAPFLGQVPLLVLAVYVVMGYLCLAMARLLLPQNDEAPSPASRFGIPVIAAGLMVLWDLSMDPLRASVEERWIWRDGGSHFGIPIQNYFGWFLTTWTMFQAYVLMRARTYPPRSHDDSADATLIRLSVPLMYLAFAVEYVLNPSVADPEHAAAFVDIAQRSVGHIHAATALLTLVTMVPLAIAAAYRALREHDRMTPQISEPQSRLREQ